MFKMSLWRELQWNVGKKVMMKLQNFGVSLSRSPGILPGLAPADLGLHGGP